MKKLWRVQTLRADFNGLAAKLGVDPVVVRLMRNRGMIEDKDYEKFLFGTLNDCHDPELMTDMNLGVDIVSAAIDAGENIRIVGDYDVDGVTSTYILYDALKRLGANVSYDIPHRVKDGYGINERIVNDAYEDGVDLILTCDNGIAAVNAIGKAAELGMTVVITDHHEIPPVLPEADAIIDPHQSGDAYPYEHICGCEVAYKFIQVLYRDRGEKLEENIYLDFVALATNCDVMPLIDENRIYVREGLKEMRYTRNLGLKTLIEVLGLSDKELNTYHLGFVIGPTINAAGKLGDAKDALELFLTEDASFARSRSEELKALNDGRKEMTERGTAEATAQVVIEEIEGEPQPVDKVLVIYVPGIHEGVAGVVAGRIRERFSRPTIIFTDTEADPNIIKGSGRSVEAYNMFEKIGEHRNLTVKFGGHPMAAGLSIKKADLERFRELLNRDAGLSYQELIPILKIDIDMPLSYASMNLARQIETMAPFGKPNDRPIFAEGNLEVLGYRIFGRNNNVMNLKVKDARGHIFMLKYFDPDEFVANINRWFTAEECDKMSRNIWSGCKLDIAYELDINEYNGNVNLDFLIKEYQKS